MIDELKLSKKAIEDFSILLKKYSEKDFPNDEVRSMASSFLQYFGKIIRPIPKEFLNEARQKERNDSFKRRD